MAKFYNLERDFPGNSYPGDVIDHLEIGDYLYMNTWAKPIMYRKVPHDSKKSIVPWPQWYNSVEMITDFDLLPEQDRAEVVLWLMEQN